MKDWKTIPRKMVELCSFGCHGKHIAKWKNAVKHKIRKKRRQFERQIAVKGAE